MHRYITTVYALDFERLGLDAGFSLEEFEAAVEGHELDRAEIVPTYTLNPTLRV